jgi:hypothetical protein
MTLDLNLIFVPACREPSRQTSKSKADDILTAAICIGGPLPESQQPMKIQMSSSNMIFFKF